MARTGPENPHPIMATLVGLCTSGELGIFIIVIKKIGCSVGTNIAGDETTLMESGERTVWGRAPYIRGLESLCTLSYR